MSIRGSFETVVFYFKWRNLKGVYKHGAPGLQRSGYESGRLARSKALRKKVSKARARMYATEGPSAHKAAEAKYVAALNNLDRHLDGERERKARARGEA